MHPVRTLLSLLFLLPSLALFAQLDTIHFVPPLHARDQWGPQYLYLSTPETQPFAVSVRRGDGSLLTTATISNTQPQRIDLGNTNNTALLVPEADLHQPLQGRGLVIDGEKKFYAYVRAHSSTQFQAGDLTCKGRAALGTTFRIGHLLQEIDDQGRRSNFVGVLATEDSTVVTLADFDPATDLRIGGASVPSTGPVTLTLQRGESCVFSQYITGNSNEQPPNGFMGALLTASRPVAVNSGSWLGAPVAFGAYDIGIDQIAPVEQVGKEYILCRGNGSAVLERPIIVAHSNGTQVWINGASSALTTLNAGDWFALQSSSYSAAGNLYIRSSEPVCIYQMIGGAPTGDDANRTEGLIFVPPISCAIPNAVDNIFQPNRIGAMTFDGGLMIVAMRDSNVTVRIDGTTVALGAPSAVAGNPDFVTYRNLQLFDGNDNISTISVVAEGAVQVAMYGRNQPASFAAFFSGFSKTDRATIEVTLTGDGVCPDTLHATGRFDGVQWMLGDSVLQYGPDTFFVAYTPGDYVAQGYLGVCRTNDIAADTIAAVFNSPAFPYTFDEPSCFGFADGTLTFGQPSGGIAPYQYSVDQGATYSPDPVFDGLAAGTYRLVARDSTGCYNRPLDVTIGQPDSFAVELSIASAPDPLKPGGRVILQGVPGRPIVSTTWEPADTTGCPDCLRYTFHPEGTIEVTLTVYDTAGCPASDRILVAVEPNIFAPNVIAPASNLGNDRFTLFTRDPLRIVQLNIYDRWGNQVFGRSEFTTNTPADGWDGTFRGEPVLPGVYVWWAQVETLPGKVEVVKGDVTVLR